MSANSKTIRDSGVEILRILSICGVIILHFVFPTGIKYSADYNTNLLLLLEQLFIGSVNIFVIITGFFMIENDTRIINKPISLLLQIALFYGGCYILSCVWGNNTFDIGSFVYTLLPRNYFVVLYISLYFVSPYVNKSIDSISLIGPNGGYEKVVVTTFMLLSLIPFTVDFLMDVYNLELTGMSTVGHFGGQSGGTLLHFIFMYMLGGVIKKNYERIKEISTHNILLVIIGSIAANYMLVLLFKTEMLDASKALWSYYNPLVIIQSCSIFLLFSRIKLKSKIINNLAKSSFACFICHGILLGYLPIERIVSQNAFLMLIYLFGSIIVFYIAVWVIYQLYIFIIEPIIMKHKLIINY